MPRRFGTIGSKGARGIELGLRGKTNHAEETVSARGEGKLSSKILFDQGADESQAYAACSFQIDFGTIQSLVAELELRLTMIIPDGKRQVGRRLYTAVLDGIGNEFV